MKLHLYLFNENIHTIQECLKNEYLPENNQKIIKLSCVKPELELTAYQCKNDLQLPDWAKKISGPFDFHLQYLKSRSTEIVIFHYSNELHRIFCITFGKGFNFINKDRVEPNFGLIFTANLISQKADNEGKAFREIDYSSIGNIPSFTKKHFDELVSPTGKEKALLFPGERRSHGWRRQACERSRIAKRCKNSRCLRQASHLLLVLQKITF